MDHKGFERLLDQNQLNDELLKAETPTDIADLLSRGADINAVDHHKRTALIIASEKGQLETVKLLVNKGTNLKLKDWFGQTAFEHAVTKGFVEIVAFLAETGAIGDDKLCYALQTASGEGHVELVKYLLDNGVHVNVSNYDGNTALIDATISGRLEMVKLLIEKNANVNAKNYRGRTALIEASSRGFLEIAMLLINSVGADLSIKDNSGLSALNTARVYKQADVERLLIESGAPAEFFEDKNMICTM